MTKVAFVNGSPRDPLRGFQSGLQLLHHAWRPLDEISTAGEPAGPQESHEAIETMFKVRNA